MLKLTLHVVRPMSFVVESVEDWLPQIERCRILVIAVAVLTSES